MSEKTPRAIRKLLHKLAFVSEEHEEAAEMSDKGKWELNLAVLEIFARAGINVPVPEGLKNAAERTDDNNGAESPENDNEFPKHPHDVDIKRLHRKISLISHPDRHVGEPDDVVFANEKIFKEASHAAQEGDIVKLIEIADSIGVDLDIDVDAAVSCLNEKIDEISRDVASIKRTPYYAWVENKSRDDIRSHMLGTIVASMGHKAGSAHLRDVLEWVKAGCPGGSLYSSPDKPRRTKPFPPRRPGTRPPKIQRT